MTRQQTSEHVAASALAGGLLAALALMALLSAILWMAGSGPSEEAAPVIDTTRSPTRALLECMIADLEGSIRPAHCTEPSVQVGDATMMEQP